MNFSFRRAVRGVIFWGVGSGICLTVAAQTVPAPAVASPGDTTITVASNLPPLPVFQPRTEFFRKVLAMASAEQEAWLTNRPPQVRAQLAVKIREYEAMTPDAREAVLRATELHEYLEYFIKAPVPNRSTEIAQVPLEYRAIVTEKLREFDLLPPELQQEVLAGKTTANYFLNPGPLAANTAHRSNPPMPPPPLPRAPLSYLNRLSADQRREMYASFQHFFDLDSAARQKILSTLPPAQRGPVAKTLLDLERMPQEQRDRGLQSISALAGMSDEQRQAFFRNAELWQQLPPAERQTWRKVVVHLPPMPPDPTYFGGPAFATNPPN